MKRLILIIIIMVAFSTGCSIMINNHSNGINMTDSPKIIPEVSASDEIRYRSSGDTDFKDSQTILDSIQ